MLISKNLKPEPQYKMFFLEEATLLYDLFIPGDTVEVILKRNGKIIGRGAYDQVETIAPYKLEASINYLISKLQIIDRYSSKTNRCTDLLLYTCDKLINMVPELNDP